jgi:hypothetical protein
MGDFQGVSEAAAKFKTDALILGPSLTLSFSKFSIAEWAAIFTIVYTVLKIAELVFGWLKKRRKK